MLCLILVLISAGCTDARALPSPTRRSTAAARPQASPTAGQETIPGASSGVVEQKTLAELAGAAELIVVGTVEEMSSQWNAEGNQIHTDVRVSVQKCVKGPWRPGQVTIRVAGGRVDDVVQSLSAGPRFEAGEEVLVFLERADEDTFRTIGGFQGKLTLSEQRLVDRDVPLESFLSEVGQIMREAGIATGACGNY